MGITTVLKWMWINSNLILWIIFAIIMIIVVINGELKKRKKSKEDIMKIYPYPKEMKERHNMKLKEYWKNKLKKA